MAGDFFSFVAGRVESRVSAKVDSKIDSLLNWSGGGQKYPLLGGITMDDAKRYVSDIRDCDPTRANLWFIEITDFNPPGGPSLMGQITSTVNNDLFSKVVSIASKSAALTIAAKAAIKKIPGSSFIADDPDPPTMINLLAQTVSYGPNTMVSDKTNIGSAVMDGMSATECTDVTLTTLDDKRGTIKRWFDGKCDQIAHSDGTWGLPKEYCIEMKIYHMTPIRSSSSYSKKLLLRPTSIQHELDRTSQELQKLSMTFSQFDTFHP